MSSNPILRENRDGVAFLTLNQPEKRNALSLALLQALYAELRAIQTDRQVRVVVLKGAGPVWSAGHDLKELAGANDTLLAEVFGVCTQVMELLPALPQPTIAMVHALATAAGCQLAASCDLVVASSTAAFAAPGVKVGLFCTTPGIPLARALPQKKALEMLFTGDPISADEALRYGLVNKVTAPEKLEEETLALAKKIAQASFQVLAHGKRTFYRQTPLDTNTAYALAEPIMVQAAGSPDCQEGIKAFFEKRKPVWPGNG
jgi:enoyl-CoA hydratase/carnithine racemase